MCLLSREAFYHNSLYPLFFSNRFHEPTLNYSQSYIVIIIVSPKLNLRQLVLGSTIVFCVIYDYSKDIHEKPA